MIRHIAIRKIYPNASIIDDEHGVFDKNGVQLEIDESLVLAETSRLFQEQKSTEYQRKREKEYPPLTELADALYHQQNGDDSKMTAYLAKVEAVKQKYPKE